MTALTNAEKQKAHRRRMAERLARYEGALRSIAERGEFWAALVAKGALRDTIPTADAD
jgi:hypothetical protein